MEVRRRNPPAQVVVARAIDYTAVGDPSFDQEPPSFDQGAPSFDQGMDVFMDHELRDRCQSLITRILHLRDSL